MQLRSVFPKLLADYKGHRTMLRKPVAALKSLLGMSTPPKDARGRRFVAVIECALNQNARDAGAACFPSMNLELLQLCHRHDVGILQMPCPEIAALGFERKRPEGQSLRQALDSEHGRGRCRVLAMETAERIESYLSQGCALLAIVGGNPRSPGCAIHHETEGLAEESGIFMKALQEELRRRGHEAVFQSMRDYDPQLLQQDLAQFQKLLVSDRTAPLLRT